MKRMKRVPSVKKVVEGKDGICKLQKRRVVQAAVMSRRRYAKYVDSIVYCRVTSDRDG